MYREWLEDMAILAGDFDTSEVTGHRAEHSAPHRACRPAAVWADAPDRHSARQTSMKSTAGCSSCCHGLLFGPLSM